MKKVELRIPDATLTALRDAARLAAVREKQDVSWAELLRRGAQLVLSVEYEKNQLEHHNPSAEYEKVSNGPSHPN
jgi:hypothetical protein